MGHAHDHAHDHPHGPPEYGRAFAIGVLLNLAFVGVEAGYGVASRSMALVADAGHNLSDVAGLAIAGVASLLAKTRPTARRTYGLRSSTILAALANAVLLLFVTGGVAWESVRRLLHPAPVPGLTVVVVALAGVLVNGATAVLFAGGRHGDLNVRSAFFHLASDAALALGVAVAGGVMMVTGWAWLDPIVSLGLSIVILATTWSLLRSSANLALGAVPEHIDAERVRVYLASIPGVREVHDLHIWAMSTTETAMTAHLVADAAAEPELVHAACEVLHDRFGIVHSTLQVEPVATVTRCRLAPGDRHHHVDPAHAS